MAESERRREERRERVGEGGNKSRALPESDRQRRLLAFLPACSPSSFQCTIINHPGFTLGTKLDNAETADHRETWFLPSGHFCHVGYSLALQFKAQLKTYILQWVFMPGNLIKYDLYIDTYLCMYIQSTSHQLNHNIIQSRNFIL